MDQQEHQGLSAVTATLLPAWRRIGATFGVLFLLGYGVAWTLPPVYTARTVFIPPQSQNSNAALALGSLGALAGIAGGNLQVRTPGDQYLAMLESTTVVDTLVKQLDLQTVYKSELLSDARKQLRKNTNAVLGKRDGLIYLDVEDSDAARAAKIANAYVAELQRLSATLAVTEAQQRRVFFERQLQQTKERLTEAQQKLERSGVSSGVLRAEPKSSAEAYARIAAEVTATEVKLGAYRSKLQPNAPEVRAAQAELAALKNELTKIEQAKANEGAPNDYIGRYREFKYQEALFELYARQYEAAKLDESREGSLIQVIDLAQAPDRRSRPVRLLIAGVAAIVGTCVYCAFLMFSRRRRSLS
ncbi:hypothetical protein CKO44_02910 [Rubrivivax gelatinosus]|uniref:Lipopolysaccharide biosynthesis protein n=1 Tax=Rubrivivax gelatinosus TaxID=28068 RepID=A0ABS1DYL2_RUBGE|nr:lipopolysaccharide biosynthesis protein [Rubrivivax gelatinosus]MBK1612415.1 hypothetical protein [Rubrivivax gelatinosus]MBK1713822.1 hypothetical protein [Rubrivivax gelatinosus]MBZ8143123.1 lipopolysaccharide biosynthesis protein [Rubrivivax gelatinosus]